MNIMTSKEVAEENCNIKIVDYETHEYEFEEFSFKKGKKWVAVDEILEKLKGLYQLSCLESWCKSRGKGEEYCRNCKTIIELCGGC